MKPNHVPVTDSEEELSAAHSRLVLKGARRVFFLELASVIETIRNEETAAAAAAIPVRASEQKEPNRKNAKRPLRNLESLGPKKADLSRYMDGLTDKQQLAFSLKWEYELQPTEIASLMGIDRKTVSEHLEAADKKIKKYHSKDRRQVHRAKIVRE